MESSARFAIADCLVFICNVLVIYFNSWITLSAFFVRLPPEIWGFINNEITE